MVEFEVIPGVVPGPTSDRRQIMARGDFTRIETMRQENIAQAVAHFGAESKKAEKLGNEMTRRQLGDDNVWSQHMRRIANGWALGDQPGSN